MSAAGGDVGIAGAPVASLEISEDLLELFAMHGKFAGRAWDAFARAWDQGSQFGRTDGAVKAKAFIEYFREFLHRDRATGGR